MEDVNLPGLGVGVESPHAVTGVPAWNPLPIRVVVGRSRGVGRRRAHSLVSD